MEAIGLFFSKFSDELLSAQIAMLSFSLALGVYWMLIRKKKRETAEWVPAALVKAYLDRMRTDEFDTRVRLFGENAGYSPTAPVTASLNQQLSSSASPTMVVSNDPALVKEIDALRAQLSMADQRAMEFDRNLNGLKAEKTTLETKLRDALNAAPVAAGAVAAADPAASKELEELRAKMSEYAVIEDELANLKKYMKENEQLRQRVSALEAGGANLKVVQGGANSEETTKISGVTEKVETPLSVVPSTPVAPVAPIAAAPPAPAPASEAQSGGPEKNTNVLDPVTPSIEAPAPAAAAVAAADPAAAGDASAEAAPAAAPEKSSKQKEEELLSEFEKMLAS